MLTIKTGNSTNANAAAAGREVALQVKEDLDNMKMAFVYSGEMCIRDSRQPQAISYRGHRKTYMT